VKLPARRPAETASAGAALALLICYALGVDDPAVLVAAGIVIGAVPGVVTWLVELYRGKAAAAPNG
jgi:hypothetical protein